MRPLNSTPGSLLIAASGLKVREQLIAYDAALADQVRERCAGKKRTRRQSCRGGIAGGERRGGRKQEERFFHRKGSIRARRSITVKSDEYHSLTVLA
jgi:hypothetical protein